MFHYRLYEHHTLYGQFYEFPARGDGIPMHDHREAQRHNIIILRGSVQVYGPDKSWSFYASVGDVVDMTSEMHPHEVVALEPYTKILGMFIHGRPDGEYLDDDEKSGTVYRPITIPLEDAL